MTTISDHKNLRRRLREGRLLDGIDLSSADIRGVNFASLSLIATNFEGVHTGPSFGWNIGLSVGLLFLSTIVSLISAYIGAFVATAIPITATVTGKVFAVTAPSLLFVAFIGIALWRGFGNLMWGFALAITAAITIPLVLPTMNNTKLIFLIFVFGLAVEITAVVAGTIAVTAARILSDKWMIALVILAILAGAPLGTISGAEGATETPVTLAVMAAVLTFLVLLGLSVYISKQAVADDSRYSLIRKIAIAVCSYRGTSFQEANLTNANFTAAKLKQADFRQANLTRARWFQSIDLSKARTTGTYLDNPKIRQLVVTLNGQDQNFDHMDLRGLNLQGANLADASFIGTKLSEATLEGANLDRAKLVQTQLYCANLSGASLTGAIIQDWSISTDTRFDGVKCDYVYMQLPTKADPDPCRKPDNRNENFEPGDFADFIAPIIKTLNLYQTQNVDLRVVAQQFKTLDLFHHEGIDPAAAAVALKQLAEHYPEANLEVVALEGRGDDKVRLQAKVKGIADRSQLSAEYFAAYREMSAMPYADLQSLLAGMAEKDERIRSLENMVTTAIKSDKFYVETVYSLGDTVTEKSSININAGGDIGSLSGIVGGNVSGVMNLGTISGNVTNSIGQLPDDSAEKAELKALLQQLQAAIEAEPALEPGDKAEALTQVQVLAEAGQNPEDDAMQKAAKTAMKILKGTTAGLSETTTFVTECAKLLPAISSLLLLL
ncbi:pentapeptide repeat-containing protein [Leptolyngbya sp. CCNP1308]|uniref:pentapeptide repeat-containing protein n=1 Tax=Leptolyngbya sp. CCNP1308 TaxID=3110255 RepID=UPI002B2040AB|nr:pentapeptide repeat-containing protein [Leptolyngbya sp. CCNP1308]MEA5447432.1 pentapeptide repeat-containing protein [Leptolyngbya sp. CCNP1308]